MRQQKRGQSPRFCFNIGNEINLLSETPLPMVLDDPFVHLDEPRRKAAEAMPERISEKRQVLYFTCRA